MSNAWHFTSLTSILIWFSSCIIVYTGPKSQSHMWNDLQIGVRWEQKAPIFIGHRLWAKPFKQYLIFTTVSEVCITFRRNQGSEIQGCTQDKDLGVHGLGVDSSFPLPRNFSEQPSNSDTMFLLQFRRPWNGVGCGQVRRPVSIEHLLINIEKC